MASLRHVKASTLRSKLVREFGNVGKKGHFFVACRSMSQQRVVDLRSDTVTMPSRCMLETALSAPLGDDVMGEDPSVLDLEVRVAEMFGKEAGLFLPTGTMSNLVAILSHCNTRASEIMAGSNSHICLWEGGNVANLGGISTMQLEEDPHTAQLDADEIRDGLRTDDDDHWPQTQLLCLENTHNMLGGIALSKSYMDEMGDLARTLNIRAHLDGARIFNAAVALDTSVHELCQKMDSVSVCLSKGLGAPLGSVLVGDKDFIRLSKRARKRCGGGMRQAGVVAAMAKYALENNVSRLQDDHQRAKYLASKLKSHGFIIDRQVDTNIVYFALPDGASCTRTQFSERLGKEFVVKLTGGYSKGGSLFRAVTHLNIHDEDIERAADAMIRLI